MPTPDKTASRVREMFGQVAPRYDFLNHFLSCGVDYGWRRKVVRRLPPNPNSQAKILDLCTGTGDLALAFWKKYRVPVVGLDFTPEMLGIGRQKAAQRKISPEEVEFLEGDACQLPFADNTFQIVTVAFGLRNVEHTDRCLAEMARVCEPGGRVAILEFSIPTFFPVRWAYQAYFRFVLPILGQLVSRNRMAAYHYLPESVQDFPQGEALAERIRQAGLVDVQFRRLTFGIATLYTAVAKEIFDKQP